MYSLLIIDDEPHIIEGVKAMMNWEHYNISRIYHATNYHDGIEKAIEYQTDIAIVDIKIDDKWGYHLVNALKQIDIKTNFIMMSGYDNFEYIHESLLAGAKDYLLKPINCDELDRIIKRIIIEDLGGEIKNIPIDEKNIDPILNIEYKNFSKLTNRMLVIIHCEYDKNINLISVADLFKMNSRYIGQVFLSETRMKFSEYLLAYRMHMARKIIENSDAKITYIAHKVGYSNTSYFYQHFKSYYMLSPSDLRQEKNQSND